MFGLHGVSEQRTHAAAGKRAMAFEPATYTTTVVGYRARAWAWYGRR